MLEALIESTQKRLLELYGPGHYYTDMYKQHERSYWGTIPTWMSEDAQLAQFNPNGVVSILDIGPGWGTLSCALKKMYGDAGKVLAVDRHQLVGTVVAKEFDIAYQTVDIERERCPRAPYGWDIVVMTEVLEHFNFHPVPTLIKIREQLAQNGRIYLSTPNQLDCWGKIRLYETLDSIPAWDPLSGTFDKPLWYDGHVWQYTHQELLQTFEKAGLKPIRWSRCRSAGGGHLIYTLTV